MTAIRVSMLALALYFMLAGPVQGGKKEVAIDAAIRYSDREIYLIAGDLLMILINNGQYATPSRQMVLGIPDSFDVVAVLGTHDKTHVYYFGKQAYYDYDMTNRSASLRNYSGSLGKFFGEDGPDAAASRDGKDFYFKGCKLATFDTKGNLKQRKVTKLGLPCRPDAAWTSEDKNKIIYLKGDEIWIWDARKKVEGPMPFSSMYNMRSWTLLPTSKKSSPEVDSVVRRSFGFSKLMHVQTNPVSSGSKWTEWKEMPLDDN